MKIRKLGTDDESDWNMLDLDLANVLTLFSHSEQSKGRSVLLSFSEDEITRLYKESRSVQLSFLCRYLHTITARINKKYSLLPGFMPVQFAEVCPDKTEHGHIGIFFYSSALSARDEEGSKNRAFAHITGLAK